VRSTATVSAEAQVVLDRERTEHLPALRTLHDAEIDTVFGGSTADVLVLENNSSFGGLNAGEGPQQGRLAGAVAAHQGDELAGAHREIDAVQHRDAPVARLEAGYVEHASVPR
jgi:hypothetical protein